MSSNSNQTQTSATSAGAYPTQTYDPSAYMTGTTAPVDSSSGAYYNYDYSSYGTSTYYQAGSGSATGYEGYDYYNYYYGQYPQATATPPATTTAPSASSAVVLEAPPTIVNPPVSATSAAPPVKASPVTTSTAPKDDSITTAGVGNDTASKQQPSTKKKQKSVLRAAAGEVWEDPTLLEWDTNDFRLFCGDLGNEVTDEVLYKAFGKYPSLQKAKVIRDKRTQKSKGYGFVSFKNPDDFVRAWKEMNGKYVGNRPIKLRKSTWKDRNIDVKAKKWHPYK